MPIKFGDLLENQNNTYAVVDGTNNSVKGLIFATSLPATTAYPNLRAEGCLLVDEDSGAMYIYTGPTLNDSDWGNHDNWASFATGDPETQQTDDLPVSIPAGLSFGRFQNGDTISVGDGKNAIEIIRDAVTSYIAPTAAFDAGAQSSIQYDTEAQTVTRTIGFSVTNGNQAVVDGDNFAIARVRLWRRKDSGDYILRASTDAADAVDSFDAGTLTALNTDGAVTAVDFDYDDSITTNAGDDGQFQYKIEVSPNDGSGTAAAAVNVEGLNSNNGVVDMAAYSAPTVIVGTALRQDVSSHFVSGSGGTGQIESNTVREKGNIASKVQAKVQCNSPGVPITSIVVERQINNTGGWTAIRTVNNLTLTGQSTQYQTFDSVSTASSDNVTDLDTTVSGYQDTQNPFPSGSTGANTIRYRVRVNDAETETTIIFTTINLEFPAIVGYSTVDGSTFDSSDNGDMTNVLHSIRDTANDRRQYEILNTSGTGDPQIGSVLLEPDGSQFVYIAYPASYAEMDEMGIAQQPSSLSTFGNGPKSETVSFTTHYGIQSTTYEVYCSNSAGAYDGTYIIS